MTKLALIIQARPDKRQPGEDKSPIEMKWVDGFNWYRFIITLINACQCCNSPPDHRYLHPSKQASKHCRRGFRPDAPCQRRFTLSRLLYLSIYLRTCLRSHLWIRLIVCAFFYFTQSLVFASLTIINHIFPFDSAVNDDMTAPRCFLPWLCPRFELEPQ